jgi:3-dehydroquinate dehydratase-2
MALFAVVLGANLNTLGKRNPTYYGTLTLDEISALIRARAEELHCEVDIVQSNSESELIDWVHLHGDDFDGLLVNPGGFTAFGQALCDAIVDTGKPWIEVHMSNIHARGMRSIWSEHALGVIAGFHSRGYIAGLELLEGIVRQRP